MHRSPASNITSTHAYASRPIPSIAAGDVANAILSSGLVCWGLKLWEYRRRLLSSAGFTILLVSCITALVNVIAGPLLAREILGPRSQAGWDLAFVAKSVTLALGAPAVSRLGGDVGLNAAMVVVNGILFQMALGVGFGDWVARWLSGCAEWVDRVIKRSRAGWEEEEGTVGGADGGKAVVTEGEGSTSLNGTSGVLDTSNRLGVPNQLLRPKEQTTPIEGLPCPRRIDPKITDENKRTSVSTLAAGVTIGINAAAMGTAHLYETNSDAAPYAALAMTVFGVATVGFTMVAQLGGWVASMVQ
jgi:putative effector of murein hydrolase